MPENGAALKVNNLVKKYYDKEVLNIERLSLERGKIYGIIGPSGAGKSTFLRLVNLLEEPTAGTMFVNGKKAFINGSENLRLRREMTLVSQKPLLFKTSVRENVAYGLKARGYNKEEIHQRVDAILEKVGLSHLANRLAETLSGGEAQRAALARAVAFGPSLLLLDEPTANLDPSNVEGIEELIMDLNRNMGMTIIIVTHNIFQAKRIAHRVLFFCEGNIVEIGDVEQIFSQPEDPRTLAFIEGKMVY